MKKRIICTWCFPIIQKGKRIHELCMRNFSFFVELVELCLCFWYYTNWIPKNSPFQIYCSNDTIILWQSWFLCPCELLHNLFLMQRQILVEWPQEMARRHFLKNEICHFIWSSKEAFSDDEGKSFELNPKKLQPQSILLFFSKKFEQWKCQDF